MAKKVKKVAFLTAGGLAPCLSSSIGFLIAEYTRKAPEVELIGYLDGYMGLLKGQSVKVTDEVRKNALKLTKHGGSPIGNSRVKLTNVKDCVKRGLVKEGDNDVYPIKQSLGAYTAAEEGARYFWNVVKEDSASPRSLVIHEVMGRNCGWLTAFTGIYYRRMFKSKKANLVPSFGWSKENLDINAVYVPEAKIDFAAEGRRLKAVMDKLGHVNIFVSEGACVKEIIKEMKKRGEEVPVDAFGHPRLDKVNVGQYFAKRFGELLGAEKTQVFKSGYFARSAAPCKKDLELIQKCCALAVDSALKGVGGVVGKDEDASNELRACEFSRVKGGKPFNVRNSRFRKMLREIGQPRMRKTRTVKK